jgi:acetyl esterase/lipase
MSNIIRTLLWPEGAPGALGDAPEDKPDLTLYLPPGTGPFACVVICPGGGYVRKAQHEGEPIARMLNGHGIAGAVVQYRVAPYRFPVPIMDAQRALRLLRARSGEWGIDAAHLGILGFSAGGHCAGMVATLAEAGDPAAADPVERQSSRPDALVACYAALSFRDREHKLEQCLRNLAEDAAGNLAPDAFDFYSVETRVSAKTPPTFLWTTADDSVVPMENCLLMAAALRQHAVPFALHVFPHGRHGLGLAEEEGPPLVKQWGELCVNWLKSLGF